MPRERTTQIRLNPEAAARLRNVAADLGYYTTRGIRAGEIGNTAALLEALAEADRLAPEDERALFRKVLWGYLGFTPGAEEEAPRLPVAPPKHPKK